MFADHEGLVKVGQGGHAYAEVLAPNRQHTFKVFIAIDGDPFAGRVEAARAQGQLLQLARLLVAVVFAGAEEQGKHLIGRDPTENTGMIAVAQHHAIDVLFQALPRHRFF